ncbi:hypothetical protein [Ensifer sp. SSB1]|jgi:hypothetical protein|uniref:hypothetical protein n=1 Tax=Ensifer sp. SSB1 TaxID=2795385 RepID=UPI001A61DC6F|nr:hypothetical protein [Ensifer sp. SSB1]MBK5567233.1 hypothetical protein [Ensifer sp. SSB1]
MGEVILFPKPMPEWRQILFEALEVPRRYWGTPEGEAIAFALASRFNEDNKTRH